MSRQKKDFSQNIGAQMFISEAQVERKKQLKKELPRMNLVLDDELKNWIDEYHWKAQLSRNDLVCSILRSYKATIEAQEAEKKE